MRYDMGKAVVLSVAGFPEYSAFDQMSAYVPFLFGERLAAEIYRPAAESLMRPGMKKGTVIAEEGVLKEAALIIDTPFDIWMDILTGKADGQAMFAEEKYTVEGDLELLMKMGDLFGREKRDE